MEFFLVQFLIDLQTFSLKSLKTHHLNSDEKLASNQTIGLAVFEMNQKFKLIL